MNAKEFIKISFILDKYGLHNEADHLTAIAQKVTTKSASQPVTIPDLQKRVDYYTKKIADYKKQSNPKMKSKMLLWLDRKSTRLNSSH